MAEESLNEFLDKRFIKKELYRKGQQYWVLQEYINFGADYGLILIQITDDRYRLDQYSDSGYTGPFTICELSGKAVCNLAESVRPTNPEYIYD